MISKAPKIYPIHLLMTTNYRLPNDADRWNDAEKKEIKSETTPSAFCGKMAPNIKSELGQVQPGAPSQRLRFPARLWGETKERGALALLWQKFDRWCQSWWEHDWGNNNWEEEGHKWDFFLDPNWGLCNRFRTNFRGPASYFPLARKKEAAFDFLRHRSSHTKD